MFRPFRPRLEVLEAREVPATMLWSSIAPVAGGEGGVPPPTPGNWFDAANWTNLNDVQDHHVPLSTDSVRFDGGTTNRDCTATTAGELRVVDMIFTNGYTGTLSASVGVNGFTVDGNLIFDSVFDSVNNKQATIEMAGAVPILGINGQFNGNTNDSGRVMGAWSVWVAGGGTNLGTIQLDVQATHINSSYMIAGSGKFTTWAGSAFVVHTNKTLTLSNMGVALDAGLSYTPWSLENYGDVKKVGPSTSYLSNVAFWNVGDVSGLTVDAGTLEIWNNSTTAWAFKQDGADAIVSIAEGAVLRAIALNSPWDAWVRFGNLRTIDVAAYSTAWFDAENLYIGEAGATSPVYVEPTFNSNVAGTLYNSIGSIVYRDNARTFLLARAEGADCIRARYTIHAEGWLCLSLFGVITTGYSSNLFVAEGGVGSCYVSFSIIAWPPGPGWSIMYDVQLTSLALLWY